MNRPRRRGRRPNPALYQAALEYVITPPRYRYGLQKQLANQHGFPLQSLNSAIVRLRERVRRAA